MDEIKVAISLPTDDNGMVGRECPNCIGQQMCILATRPGTRQH